MVVLKELISSTCLNFNSLLGRVWWSLRELIFNSFYFGRGCGGLERTDFNSFYLGGCGGLERTDF